MWSIVSSYYWHTLYLLSVSVFSLLLLSSSWSSFCRYHRRHNYHHLHITRNLRLFYVQCRIPCARWPPATFWCIDTSLYSDNKSLLFITFYVHRCFLSLLNCHIWGWNCMHWDLWWFRSTLTQRHSAAGSVFPDDLKEPSAFMYLVWGPKRNFAQ